MFTFQRGKHCWHPSAVMGVVDTFGQVLVHKASNLEVSINDKGILNVNVLEQSSQSIIWQISDLQRDLASEASCLYCAVETLIQS